MESCLTFRFSCIMSLTAYAQVVYMLATSPTSTAESAVKFRDECSCALNDIIVVVEETDPDEFLTMGGLIGVSIFIFEALFYLEFNEVLLLLDDVVSCPRNFQSRALEISPAVKPG